MDVDTTELRASGRLWNGARSIPVEWKSDQPLTLEELKNLKNFEVLDWNGMYGMAFTFNTGER